MPGALVGEAYVLMRSDGTLLKADMSKAAQSAARAAGTDGAREFRKSWNREFNKSQKDLDEGLALSFARMAGQRDFRRYIRQFKSIEEATKNLNKELDLLTQPQNGKEALLTKTMRDQIRAGFNESVKILRAEQAEIDATAEAERKRLRQLEINTNIEKQIRAEEKQGIREVVKEVEDRARAEDDHFKKRIKNLTTLDNRVKLYYKERDRIARITNERAVKYERQVVAEIKQLTAERNRAHAEAISEQTRRNREAAAAEKAILLQRVRYLTYYDKRVRGLVTYDIPDPVLKRIRKQGKQLVREGNTILIDWDKRVTRPLGNRVGRLFGQGARNDFVNAIGRSVNFLVRQLTTVVGIGAKFAGAVTSIGKGFIDFGKILSGGGGFKKALAALGGGFSNALKIIGGPQGLVTAVATLAGSVILFGKVIPGVVSAVLGLAGGLGSILAVAINGVAAAAVTAIPVLAGLGAQFGALGIATYKWAQTDRAKALFKSWNKEISNIVERLFPELEAVFGLLRRGTNSLLVPVIKNLSKSLDNLITNLGGTVNGIAAKKGPTQTALREWKKTIVAVSKDFGDAFSNFTVGLINFFRPILPYAREFSQYIADGAKAFKEWTLGQGQKDIKEWIDGAVVALKETWGLLGDIGGLIIDTFFSGPGQDTGKSLIRSLRDWVQEIRDNIAANPDALADWFADARRITEDIGELAESIGGIISELNSPEARNSGQDLIASITTITDNIKTMAGYTDQLALVADYVILIVGSLFKLGTGDAAGAYKLAIEKIADISARQARVAANEIKQQTAEAERSLRELTFEDYKIPVTVTANTEEYETLVQAIEDYVFSGKTIDIDGNKSLWDKVKGTVAGYVFDTKDVGVQAEDSYWKNSKRLIERYEFPKKYVPVDVQKPTLAELYAIRTYISNNLTATARVRVIMPELPNGSRMTGGGITVSAAGRIATQPTKVLIGEAGPEAVVPLARNLNAVDASVRQLSAIAQGKTIPMASGGVVGGETKNVVVEPGAVVVTTRATSPTSVGSIVFDGIAGALSSAV